MRWHVMRWHVVRSHGVRRGAGRVHLRRHHPLLPLLPMRLAPALRPVAFAFAAARARLSPLPGARAQATGAPTTGFAVEYYYKIKWGFQAEWMELYKRNHYPILLEQQKLGRIVSMSAATPRNHAGEANRWDFRYTIVWKDAATAHDDFDGSGIIKALYPDQERFRKEEQRRFELLVEHTDIPVVIDDLKGWKK
ncbi:MAG TPA: hypothetical protein VFV33_26825 [Gemmatimonadaceae bacterium]|nr:hypothetical protein [Gemmatimonadaceae bacterium]